MLTIQFIIRIPKIHPSIKCKIHTNDVTGVSWMYLLERSYLHDIDEVLLGMKSSNPFCMIRSPERIGNIVREHPKELCDCLKKEITQHQS